jgi:hypothetical protein
LAAPDGALCFWVAPDLDVPLNFAFLLPLTKLRRSEIVSNLLNVGPSENYLFDHIPRTGGTYFAEVLSQLIGSTSENIDCGPDYPEVHADEIRRLDKFQVVVGHMRLDTIRAFRQIRPRRLISLVREPAGQIESTYTFWRYNVKADLPHCNLAKELPFGEFIRVPELRMTVDNPMTRHIFSLWDLEKVEISETSRMMAVKMADSYAFIGVTERMEESIAAFTKLFPTRNTRIATKRIDRNASHGTTSISSKDLEFLHELNELDYLIYGHINACLDRTLAAQREGLP